MNWERLLSAKRLGETDYQKTQDRSPYLIDVDRLIYSTHFRKLQDKTQVHPLSKSDYVRTRLTHSLEVSSISRSLGYAVGRYIIDKYNLQNISEHDFGYIVQAAALAHDIGNPPFGHLGEDAISAFFQSNKEILKKYNLSQEEYDNLTCFDGNSQGFRIITNLAGWKNDGGLKLTYATLGTFLKYPCGFASKETLTKLYSTHKNNFVIDKYTENFDYKYIIGTKKTGIMKNELTNFLAITKDLGLLQLHKKLPIFYRHPLAFLTESADDIGYCIADIEDAFFVGLLSLAEVELALAPIARHPKKYTGDAKERTKNLRLADFYKKMDNRKKVEWLRGKAISNLIAEVSQAFIANEEMILKGAFNCELIGMTPFVDNIKDCKLIAREKIFHSHDKITAEIKGIEAIDGTLEELFKMIINPTHPKSKRILNLLEKKMIIDTEHLITNSATSFYQKLCLIIDILSDFTDRNLLEFYAILKGNTPN